MQLIVNHLTRMSHPRICVAGIDPATMGHVRPVTSRFDLITRALLRQDDGQGGPLGIGSLVDLGSATPRPSPPESEDYEIATSAVRHVERLDDDVYLQVLHEVSSPDLQQAFGPALYEVRADKYAVDAGRGTKSLAVVELAGRPRLYEDSYGKLQLEMRYPDTSARASITDVRFFEADQTTIKSDVVDDVNQRLRRGVDAYVMLGLARAFAAPGDDRERHWLQANGICLVDQATGLVP